MDTKIKFYPIVYENYKLYVHINKTNNKKYFGITGRSVYKRWGKDGKNYKTSVRFYNSIKKYKWSGFEHNIIMDNLTKFEANYLEINFIKYYKTSDEKFGYNLQEGGSGGLLTPVVKTKISKSRIGSKNPFYNKHHSKETIEIFRHQKSCKPVICLETGIKYYSIQDAVRKTRIKTITNCVNGQQKTAGGYHWLKIK